MPGIESTLDDQGAVDKLRSTKEEVNDAINKALLALALKTQFLAQKLVPVEYGKLRASAFVKIEPGEIAYVRVGFSADYASYVNDKDVEKLRGQPRPSGLGTYWSPGGSHFMEKALAAIKPEIVPTIERFVEDATK